MDKKRGCPRCHRNLKARNGRYECLYCGIHFQKATLQSVMFKIQTSQAEYQENEE